MPLTVHLTQHRCVAFSMLARSAAASVLFAVACLVDIPGKQAALNIDTYAVDDLVTKLRRSIFIEKSHLAPKAASLSTLSSKRETKSVHRISSLDGPGIFHYMHSIAESGEATAETTQASVDGPGVIPESFLQDFGLDQIPGEFKTLDYNTLEYLRQKFGVTMEEAEVGTLSRKMLTGFVDGSTESDHVVHADSEHGILHFSGLMADRRLPLTFSRGLPGNVIATWDGKWLVHDCVLGQAEGSAEMPLALPAPDADVNPGALMLRSGSELSYGGNSAKGVTVDAKLFGNVGYLRFSRPVIIRSLFARWTPQKGAAPGLIGGRRGLQNVWTTHLNSEQLRERSGWFDVSPDGLEQVDEVAFISARGLEIGALEVFASDVDSEDEQRTVLMLVPVKHPPGGFLPEQPRVSVQVQQLSFAAAPHVISLHNAIQQNLQLQSNAPTGGGSFSRGIAVPGLLKLGSFPYGEGDHGQEDMEAATVNQEMFDHRLLEGPASVLEAEALMDLIAPSSVSLPQDLRSEFLKKNAARSAMVEALLGWGTGSKGGGWSKSTPLSLPQNGTEAQTAKYVTAKRWQTKLDVLTAAFLYHRK